MSPRDRSRYLPPLFAALLLVLLAALAALQYRWIGRVSDLERQRQQARLHVDGTRFTEDFDRELTRAFLFFHPEPSSQPSDGLQRVVRQLDRWQAEAPWPDLVRDVLAVGRRADGQLEISRLEPGGDRFVEVSWPAGMERLRQRLSQSPAPGRPPFPWAALVEPEIPGLVIPFFLSPFHETAPADGTRALIVRLDERVVTGQILPELTRRHFGSPRGGEFIVAVLDARERPIFRSDPEVALEAFDEADIRLGMLGLRPFHELRNLWLRKEERPRTGREEPAHREHIRIAGPGPIREMRSAGSWHLVVHHRKGSLEDAVAAVRRHNLAVSLGILALLAGTSGLLFVTSQRAQRLARQQIEFVAGVTHELHTPLTAMRSAGQNLADGVVADPQQVRRYGALIEAEGRRLSDMVGQVLELAGIQSGRRVYQPRPESVEAVVDRAVDDCRGLLEQKNIRVEREIPPDLPPVLADGEALRRALRNLIENAVRHGGAAGWVGVRAQRRDDGVEITVSDRGPGIRREDLPHLFEPFYRGRDTLTNGVPGSGLGLSVVRHVVEALGGKVSVASNGSDTGSAFTVLLPAALESRA